VALLTYLLLQANRPVLNDALVDALWETADPRSGVRRLHVAVARLRKTLEKTSTGGESRLQTSPGGYLLALAPGELDAEAFESGLEQGRAALEQGEPRHAADLLRDALALWRGPPLADVAYEPFAQAEIRRLDELRIAALEARIEADLALGRHAGVIGELEALVAAHPTREGFAAQLMIALYRAGRQADALEAYGRVRAYLSTELGLEPGQALRSLQARVLVQDASLDAPVAEAGRPQSRPDGSAIARTPGARVRGLAVLGAIAGGRHPAGRRPRIDRRSLRGREG
jgi:DNA-binding SARP family transcriptional activator